MRSRLQVKDGAEVTAMFASDDCASTSKIKVHPMQCPKETVASASWTMLLTPLGVTHVMPFTYSHVDLRPRYLSRIRCLHHSFVYIYILGLFGELVKKNLFGLHSK
jgi:hypothetical protein